MCACVAVCVSLASDSSETVEVTVIKLGMVTAAHRGMLRALMIISLTLTFIPGHTDRNHEHMFDYFINYIKGKNSAAD